MTEEVKKRSPQGPNIHLLYADPLPYVLLPPLPPLHLHNPLSYIPYILAYLFPSTPTQPTFTAAFHPESRSCHVDVSNGGGDGLWFKGFFGKGTLSRSEPTWFVRARRAVGEIGQDEHLTSEEITARRRAARQDFKKEREKAEQKERERILREERGEAPPLPEDDKESESEVDEEAIEQEKDAYTYPTDTNGTLINLEHLQLTLPESLFLAHALGTLTILDPHTSRSIPQSQLLPLFRRAYNPVLGGVMPPDDPFMLNYVVYHHFRSLGWVVKPGVKFAVDYLLYRRGPVFSHAEFAIMIIPSYAHPSYEGDVERKRKESRPWHLLHSTNRVCSQVKKTVILCFVEVPPVGSEVGGERLEETLRRYKVREVSIRRWQPSRNRD
ncbi:radiation sensitive protein rad9 [Saitoella coloradoensis]